MDFNTALFNLQGKDVYLFCEPDVLDFTVPSLPPSKLVISSKEIRVELPLDLPEKKLRESLSYLQAFLGGESSLVITWNWKNFLSFVKGKTGILFSIIGKLFELSCFESYLGIRQDRPNNFLDARQRLISLTNHPGWNKAYFVYQQVFLPLISTLPKIESFALLDKEQKKRVYAFYEIDGQANGRLKASGRFKNYFNPHTLGNIEKEKIKPLGWDSEFLVFDYKHMEVSVLQWLSQDRFLGKLLETKQDVYASIWNQLFPTVSCNSHHRRTCKEFFLPVIYGMGSENLSQKISWPIDICRNLIDKIYQLIPDVFNWIRSHKLINGMCIDYYGRYRHFDQEHKIRNFLVQSPAALICLHKLNKLTEALPVAMHIHDGYAIVNKKTDTKKNREIAKEILEAEDDFCPGLQLRTSSFFGDNLNCLKEI